MTRVTSSLDPFSPEFRADPYAAYEELRALGPVVWLEQHDIWCVHHYATCQKVLSDYAVFSNAGGGGIGNYFVEKPWRKPSIILEVDPPEHTRTRSVMNRVLSPRVFRELRAGFEEVAAGMVSEALAKGEIDGVWDLSRRFPLKVFPDSVGVEDEGRDNLLIYGAMVFGAFGPVGDWYKSFMAEHADVSDWIIARCQRDRLAPGGIGQMIYEAADRGEITDEEAMMLVRTFLSAGVDTTVDSIGLCLKALAERPDQYALLRADPSLARNAFEEATRYDSSSQSIFRTTLCETEIEGQKIGKHEKVMSFLGSAGRDPERWEDPDTFDITRKIKGQIGYGVGIHGCVGQMFARLEGEVLIRAVAEQVERLELTGTPEFRLNPGLRGLDKMPMRLH
ncbi:cytochrome P450 [Mesobacterium pallidum]|uniref:cytochrome P450 n=1 Tax=Mesobacterium pallidum TaxID=2872037 RepID=UPI001EE19667|nr:cytochrome P450 [Mesobacterium pallidum]